MRRTLILAMLLVALGAPLLTSLTHAAQPTEAAVSVKAKKQPTCFGKKATIPDHVGIIEGTPANDVIIGDDQANDVVGNGGFDRICTGGGNDGVRACGDDACSLRLFVNGGAGDDSLAGGDGEDQFIGSAGDDDITAASGDDELFGGKGDDVLRGGLGNDLLEGGRGTDECATENFDLEPC